MHVGMMLNEFPAISETFILDQIVGLLERGHSLSILATYKSQSAKCHAAVETHDLLKLCYFAYPNRKTPLRQLRTVANLARLTPAYPKLFRVWRRVLLGSPSRLLEACFAPLLSGHGPFDVLHCHFGSMALAGVMLRRAGLFSAPIVATFHGSDITSPAPRRRQDYQELMPQMDLCTVSTDFLRDRALALGAKPQQLRKLPMGVDLNLFPCRDFDRPRDPAIRILSVCRLVEVKGVALGIRAIATLAKEIPTIEFLIAGDGPLRQELHKLAEQLNVSDRVHFLGRQTREQVIELYHKCDIFLYSGIIAANGAEEGQGVTLLEAQATGMPIVATRVGGVPEAMQEGHSGILVAPQDVEGIANALKHLITNADTWPAMGRAGRAFVKTRYDQSKLNDHLVAIYREAIAQHRA